MWQPIDTAPKDGRYVLVCDEDGIYIASYQETWIDGRNWRIQIDEGCVMPTRWMPLPDYPR